MTSQVGQEPAHNEEEERKKEAENPFLWIREVPVYFEEDWDVGIGGGLWSTGLAFARYLTTDHAQRSMEELFLRQRRRLNALELGSGNGFLSLCLLALAQPW